MLFTSGKTGETVEIDIQKLAICYLRRWWLILLAAILFGGLSYGYTKMFVGDTFQASTTIYVNNFKEGTQVDSVSGGNLSTSQQLVATYISIVKSKRVLEKASEALDGDYSSGQLSGMISASQVNGTEIFAIYAVSTSPTEAARIANAFAEVVPIEIADLIDGSSARVLDYAEVPTQRYQPNYKQRTERGALIGAAIVLIILTIIYLLDVRIKDESDLKALFDLPVLGQIPEFEPKTSSHKSSSKDYSKDYEKSYESTDKTQKGGG